MGAYKSDDEDDISPNEARAIELEDDQLLSIKAAHFNVETTSPLTSPNLQSTPRESIQVINLYRLHFFTLHVAIYVLECFDNTMGTNLLNRHKFTQ